LEQHWNDLTLVRHPETVASDVVDLRVEGEDLVLRCTSPDPNDGLLLIDEADNHATPTAPERWQDEVLTTRIATRQLGLELGSQRLLAVGSPTAWHLVVRARNDLHRPDESVVLPIVEDPSSQFPGTGFSYLPDGSLVLTRRLR